MRIPLLIIGLAGWLCLSGCGLDLRNVTASLGGNTAGSSGTFRVVVINNTPHQVTFTLGSYDQVDPTSQPDVEQFGISNALTALEANQTSRFLTFRCGRALGVGSPMLLQLIEANLPDTTVVDKALVDGVRFFSVDDGDAEGDDPDAAAPEPQLVGTARPLEALLGVDFACNALIVLRLEFDDSGQSPFRVDFTVVPSDSTR